jgi:hypothetical protein
MHKLQNIQFREWDQNRVCREIDSIISKKDCELINQDLNEKPPDYAEE